MFKHTSFRASCRHPLTALLVLVHCMLTAQAAPIPTAFTYQGELVHSNLPVTAQYDFQFSLFTDPVDGFEVAGPLHLDDISVTDGLFSITLDFGEMAVGREALWLDISLRETGSADPFVVLEPRQAITAAPFALQVPENSITTFEADSAQIQTRVSSLCSAGSSIRQIREDGGVTCQPDNDGAAALLTHSNLIDAHHPEFWESSVVDRLFTRFNFVGINDTNPEATLHIHDSGSTHPALLIEAATVSEGDIAWPLGETLQMGTWDSATETFSRHVSITSDGLAYIDNAMYFDDDQTGDKISLIGNRLGQANMYGFGVGTGAVMYYKANQGHAWYVADADPDVSNSSMFLANSGLGIGTETLNGYRLAVNGGIRAKEIVVETGWSDFVFEPDYDLPTLAEVEAFIQAHGHLKDIPSAADVARNGVNLGEVESRLLQKIEELTLYTIQLRKDVDALTRDNESLRASRLEDNPS